MSVRVRTVILEVVSLTTRVCADNQPRPQGAVDGRFFTLPLTIVAAAFLAGCGSSGPDSSPRDATSDPAYRQAAEQLAALNREAETDFANGKSDDAAALIEKGKPLETKLLSVSHPTLAAVEALSDRDQLYGKMLFSNRHYGWARLMFQKNLARWKYWQPHTADTERRFKEAQVAIDDCDRHIEQ